MHTPIMDLITSPLLLQENNFAMIWRARRRTGNAPRGIMQDQHGLTAEHRQNTRRSRTKVRVPFHACCSGITFQWGAARTLSHNMKWRQEVDKMFFMSQAPCVFTPSTRSPRTARQPHRAPRERHRGRNWTRMVELRLGGASLQRHREARSAKFDNNSTVRCRSLLPKPPTERNLQHLAGNMEDAERQRGARKVRRSTHFTITEFNEATSCAVSISQTRANIADGRNRSIPSASSTVLVDTVILAP